MRKCLAIFSPLFCYVLLNTYAEQVTAASNDFTYDGKGKRDPFSPWKASDGKDKMGVTAAKLRVQGVIIDPAKGSLAIINGAVLREGDTIGPYRILKVQKTMVILTNEGETVTLPFKSEE